MLGYVQRQNPYLGEVFFRITLKLSFVLLNIKINLDEMFNLCRTFIKEYNVKKKFFEQFVQVTEGLTSKGFLNVGLLLLARSYKTNKKI